MRTLTILTILLMLSCTPPVVFDQAYPTDQEDLLSIPRQFQGAYICESDSALIMITDSDITLHKSHYFTTKVKYLEQREDCRIQDDKVYINGREECIPIEVVNDSIVRGAYQEIDTLFYMQEGSVARLHNGHLVINQELKRREWAVSLLSPQLGGDLTYKAITNKTKIKNVERVTRTKDITTAEDKNPRYKVRPTMTEFDKLLADEKIFIECEYLVKVNLDNQIIN